MVNVWMPPRSTKQLVSAVGEGATPGLIIREYVRGIKAARPAAQ
jgi:hypothetical protein